MGSRRVGFSSCGTRARQLWLTGSRAQAQYLWCTGLVALRHVGSSQTGARTRVPCTGRRILNHCASRQVPWILFKSPLSAGLLWHEHQWQKRVLPRCFQMGRGCVWPLLLNIRGSSGFPLIPAWLGRVGTPRYCLSLALWGWSPYYCLESVTAWFSTTPLLTSPRRQARRMPLYCWVEVQAP